jgi:hypothetical protein
VVRPRLVGRSRKFICQVIAAKLGHRTGTSGVKIYQRFKPVHRLSGVSVPFKRQSVTRDRGVDGAGPGVDAAGERLDVLEALVSEPHRNVQ